MEYDVLCREGFSELGIMTVYTLYCGVQKVVERLEIFRVC